jgi:hypothetical protein
MNDIPFRKDFDLKINQEGFSFYDGAHRGFDLLRTESFDRFLSGQESSLRIIMKIKG